MSFDESYLKSRPELQRDDLAPIVNYLAVSMYNRAADMWEPDEYVMRKSETLADLGAIGHAIIAPLMELNTDICDRPRVVRAMRPLLNLETPNMQYKKATYYNVLEKVMEEGLKSGVVIPLMAYRYLHGPGDPAGVPLDTQEVANMLRSKPFQATMIRASIAPNTTYGNRSTEPYAIPYMRNNVFASQLKSGAVFTHAPRGIRLSDTMHERLKGLMSNHVESGGCPARWAVHKRIGKYAVGIAKKLKIPLEELENQGTSAITAGCEYVASCFDKLAH